jgi:hypothetical protein
LEAKTNRTPTCWLWQGARTTRGYGTIYFDGRYEGTHRVAWMLDRGPIADGMVVAHTCDNPPCVNPAHLFLTTQAGNLADMRVKAREARGPELAAAIAAGWTAELRQRRGEQTRERERQRHEAAACAAGVPLNWKRCPICGEWKPRSEYHRNAARHDGLKARCKPCSIRLDSERRRHKRA